MHLVSGKLKNNIVLNENTKNGVAVKMKLLNDIQQYIKIAWKMYSNDVVRASDAFRFDNGNASAA